MKRTLLLLFSLYVNVTIAQQDSITVYYFMGEDCPICQDYSTLMVDLYEEYNAEDISFVGLFPNRYSTTKGIDNYQKKYAIPFPLKREFFQTKTKLFDIKVTPEVVVYNETQAKMIYKGRIDNMYARVGKRRRVVNTSELEDVLAEIQKGAFIEYSETVAVGCFITLE